MDRHRRVVPSYHVGQRVWLSTRNLKLPACCKLSAHFIGSFKILQRVARFDFSSYRRLSHLPYISCIPSEAGEIQCCSLPDDGDDPSSRHAAGRFLCLQGLNPVEFPLPSRTSSVSGGLEGFQSRTFMGRSADILDPHLVTDFHTAHPSKPAPQSSALPSSASGRQPSGGGRVTNRQPIALLALLFEPNSPRSRRKVLLPFPDVPC